LLYAGTLISTDRTSTDIHVLEKQLNMVSTRITPDIKIHKNPTFSVRNEIHFIRNPVVLTFL